ncbi:MAG: PCRF domain-containing protein, partial [Candidatus Neomarinimicrobiota bacterium]|nr:PCRF domain-containing protein [Candidatus Neomarinimicrobiota bacterium]
MDILSKAKNVIVEYDNITQEMINPDNMLNQEKMTELLKKRSNLEELYTLSKEFIVLNNELNDLEELSKEEEMEELVKSEKPKLLEKITSFEKNLTKILITNDPNDNKNAIIEIRAGTGGDEAGLFAGDLFRMYSKYAEKNNMSIKVMDVHETGVGGLKSIIFNVEGQKAYGLYKYEGGVHRVQRIPKTESGGRVHTSAATV